MHICIQSLEEVLIRGNILFKIFISVSKDAEFHADYKSIEKIKKTACSYHLDAISYRERVSQAARRKNEGPLERKLQEQI
jgi:hypothetical protein